MNKSVAWARNQLPYSLRLDNPTFKHKGHPQEFLMFETMLENLYGKPKLYLEPSRYSKFGMFWKRNKDGVWARFRNEFVFESPRIAMVARLYMPADYKVIKKII